MSLAASRLRVHAAALACALAALLVMSSSSADAREIETHRSGEETLLTLINRARSQVGSPHLVASADLATAARRHAVDMAASDQRFHQSDFSAICCWVSIAENVSEARGVDTRSTSAVQQAVDRAHRRLMESSSHRANILNRDFHDVGIGVAVNHATSTVWVAQMFRQRTDGPLRPVPAPPRPDPTPAPQAAPEPSSADEPDVVGRPLAAHEPQRHDGVIGDRMVANGVRPHDRTFGDPVAAAVVRARAPIPHAEAATHTMSDTPAGAGVGRWSLAVAIASAAAVALRRRRRAG